MVEDSPAGRIKKRSAEAVRIEVCIKSSAVCLVPCQWGIGICGHCDRIHDASGLQDPTFLSWHRPSSPRSRFSGFFVGGESNS